MFLLTRSILDPDLYCMDAMDAPVGGSEVDMMTNIWESATIMENWETAFPKAKKTIAAMGFEVDDVQAESVLKHYYQTIRHGMSFDWPMNYVIDRIKAYYPFVHYPTFKGTDPFFQQFADDQVFDNERRRIEADLEPILAWVFDVNDRMVFRNISDYCEGRTTLPECLTYIEEHPPVEPFVIPTLVAQNVNYLVLLCELLHQAVGYVKREYWTNIITQIAAGQYPDRLVVCGSKLRAFVFGNPDGTVPRWRVLEDGIELLGGVSGRMANKDYLRVIPDQMTFFRLGQNALYVDESMFPKVSIDGGPFLAPNDFCGPQGKGSTYPIDRPLRMRIKYDFPQNVNAPKIIKLTAKTNCIIKDPEVLLDAQGEAETQIVFRGTTAGFKVVDSDKQYPFGFFTLKNIASVTGFDWLVDDKQGEGNAE